MKDVTVVIPSYNRARILPKTIPTYIQPEVKELIIIDDCSSDNTMQVVKKLQKKYPIIKYFRNEVNSKQTFSKNVGIKNASCDYIYFGDDDSIIKPGTIRKLIEVKEKYLDKKASTKKFIYLVTVSLSILSFVLLLYELDIFSELIK